MVLSMNRWIGKVAVITGASSGIGAAIVDQLVENGLQVVGIARRIELIEKRATELNSTKKGQLHPLKADFSKEEEIISAFKWIEETVGPIHILINNAGLFPNTTLIDGDSKLWKAAIDLNILGLCIATREVIRIMRENGINNGHIIHMNSISGHKVPIFPFFNVYSATKFAVTSLTETLRQEINNNNLKIKITSISPGVVDTEMTISSQTSEWAAIFDGAPSLKAGDVADAVRYVLSTPEHVQIHELTIKPVGESL